MSFNIMHASSFNFAKFKIMDSGDFVHITYSYIKLTHEHGYEFSYTEIPALYMEAEKSKSPKKKKYSIQYVYV